MSASDTEHLIARFFRALNKSDTDLILACLSEDVAHDINQGGREIGRERYRRHAADRMKSFDEQLSDIVVMVAEGGVRAAAEFTAHGRYVATAEGLPPAHGQHYSIAAGMFFEIDDGLISRISDYANAPGLMAQLSRDD